MPVPAHAIKCVFKGAMQGGEVFNHSLWFDYGAQPTQLQLDSLNGVVASTFNTSLNTTAVKANFPTTMTYNTVTSYSYAGGPHVDRVSGPLSLATWIGTGASALPNQCAMVMSIKTGTPGRSFRGRIYLPAPAAGAISSTGQVGNTTINSIGNAWISFLTGMAAGGGGVPVLHLQVVSATRGVMTSGVSLLIDSRLDVQRRRANKQAVSQVNAFSIP